MKMALRAERLERRARLQRRYCRVRATVRRERRLAVLVERQRCGVAR